MNLNEIIQNPEIVDKNRDYRNLKEHIECSTDLKFLAERVKTAIEYIDQGNSAELIKKVLKGELC